jgi:hypothetical protein
MESSAAVVGRLLSVARRSGEATTEPLLGASIHFAKHPTAGLRLPFWPVTTGAAPAAAEDPDFAV